jgi:hypothetical protein
LPQPREGEKARGAGAGAGKVRWHGTDQPNTHTHTHCMQGQGTHNTTPHTPAQGERRTSIVDVMSLTQIWSPQEWRSPFHAEPSICLVGFGQRVQGEANEARNGEAARR